MSGQAVTFTVDGIPQLQQALAGLPRHIQKEAMEKAIPVAGEMVRSAIAAAAPVRTGRLRGSIAFFATQIGGAPSGVVVPNRKRGKGGAHAHLVEFGTAPHEGRYYRHKSQHPGTPARPFFEPSVEATSDAALDGMVQTADSIITSYWESQGGAA